LQQQKALSSAGRNMIAASSTGDMLEEPTHLSNSQPKARSMETTSEARASNGNTSPVKIDAQLGAAFDQSMPSNAWSCRMPSEVAAKSELSLDLRSPGRRARGTALSAVMAMILNSDYLLKPMIGNAPQSYSSDLIPFIGRIKLNLGSIWIRLWR
jgi:hypothetical protein